MKKFVSAIVLTMAIALTFAIAASAEETVFYPNTNGLYEITYDLSDVSLNAEDGTQFGMVAIEATGSVEEFELAEDDIRYIDQVESQDNALSAIFAPMDLADGGTYMLYIGGGELTQAEYIGTLYVEVESVTLNKNAETVTVGNTVTLTATVLPEGATDATVTWESDDEDVATVENGVVTGVAEGTATITVSTADGAYAECTITVTETTVVPGDMDGDGDCDDNDAIHLLFHALVSEETYSLPEGVSGDVNSDGECNDDDAIHLLFHVLVSAETYPLYPAN